MNLLDMKTFLTLLEYRSISLSAKKLHITQSAMSKRIQRLENELNTQLFIITKHSIQLTDKGKTLVPYARQVLHAFEGIKKHVNNTSKEPSHIIHIASSVYVSSYLMIDLTHHLNVSQKTLKINNLTINEKDLAENLYQGMADLVICSTQKVPPKIASSILWEEPLYFVVSKTHPLAKNSKNVTLNELANYTASVMEKGFAIREQLESLFEQNNLPLDIGTEVSLAVINAQIIEQGSSWGLIHARLLNDKLKILNIPLPLKISFSWFCLEKRVNEKSIQMVINSLNKWAER